MEEHLRQIQVENLIITGVVTNICVLHTAADAALRGYRLVAPKDCVAALDDHDQEYGLHHMQFLFQAEVTSADGGQLPGLSNISSILAFILQQTLDIMVHAFLHADLGCHPRYGRRFLE